MTAKTDLAHVTDFQHVFELTAEGRRVLSALEAKFAKHAYVKGGLDAERETTHRLGQQSVLNFIYTQIDRANSGAHEAAQNDD